MLATCAPRCTAPASLPLAGTRRLVAVAASRQKQRKPSDALTAPQPEEALPAAVPTGAVAVSSSETKLPENDPWEGENFEFVGKVASALIPVLAALAVGVGLFASQTYNEGATIFLDAPKGPEDKVKLIPAEQLQQLQQAP